MKKILEHLSLYSAIAASFLIAFSLPVWAFPLYIVSNVTSLYILKGTNTPGVIKAQLICFLIANTIGISRLFLTEEKVCHVEHAPTAITSQIK